jgi:hypothetical protein
MNLDFESIARRAVNAVAKDEKVLEVRFLREIGIVFEYIVRTRSFREFTVTINKTDGCGIVVEAPVILHECFTINEDGGVQVDKK